MEQRAICVHAELCGGCVYQGVEYQEQLQEKDKIVNDLITSKKLNIKKIESMQASPNLYGYRNKMEYTFGDMEKDGETTLGMHPRGKFMSVLTVDECQLVHDDFNKILSATLNFVKEKGYRHYNKKSHKGIVRHLQIRKSMYCNEILVNIITSSQGEFDEEGWLRSLKMLELENELVGVVRTINDRIGDSVACDELKVLYGRDYYNEKIAGLEFQVSVFSFFQTNVVAAEKLYLDAISLIDNLEGKVVFDLFCGTGTISQIVAKQGAKKVIGVEIVKDAVDMAKVNAKLNNLENCEFICGDVFDVLEKKQMGDALPDVIVVDPPRAGIQPKALDKILSYGVKQIVYISCNPKSLMDNLYYMSYNGYDVMYLKPYDNYAFNRHVEVVVSLVKKDV
ncbi:MAG: 23S rRNA (uracil(1939)-C(5))-methyltransferase RlmD [Eubacteriales bacterium]|nr:23S rRNA (uracil(1939)-C(5))-methyltransferase RlmD [Eubacteriales bacterium]MDY3332873.1 23S rRNA (uracil(1939)-C(5))-methyltransferase RlmD [Gallibacter sp.]